MNIKKIVRVTIEKEIEIEFTEQVLGAMTEEEYLAEFRKSLWEVGSMDDVIKYAAAEAATGSEGYEHDGIGLLGMVGLDYPKEPAVKYREISDDLSTEIIEG